VSRRGRLGEWHGLVSLLGVGRREFGLEAVGVGAERACCVKERFDERRWRFSAGFIVCVKRPSHIPLKAESVVVIVNRLRGVNSDCQLQDRFVSSCLALSHHMSVMVLSFGKC
jgi:hypothetical protein